MYSDADHPLRRTAAKKNIVVLLAGIAYWCLVGRVAGTAEPWDAATYWHLWYPVSLALSAIAGAWLGRHGWAGGAILTFAQLTVMWLNSGTAPLWAVALLMLAALAVPAVIVSALSGWLAKRRARP